MGRTGVAASQNSALSTSHLPGHADVTECELYQ